MTPLQQKCHDPSISTDVSHLLSQYELQAHLEAMPSKNVRKKVEWYNVLGSTSVASECRWFSGVFICTSFWKRPAYDDNHPCSVGLQATQQNDPD